MSKVQNEKYDRKKFYSEEKYKGVRRRYAGKVIGLGDDWTYYVQFRIKDKVISKMVGKLSEGITAKKAAYIRDKMILEYQSDLNIQVKQENKTELSITKTDCDQEDVTLLSVWKDYLYVKQDKKYTHRLISYFKNLKPFYYLNPKDINTRMVENFRIELEHTKNTKGKKYSPKSIMHHLKLLQTLINHGVKRELCQKNPNLYIEMPKVNNIVTEFLTKEQLERYKQALAEDEDRIGAVFITIALYTGMRRKAILNLKWNDIDFVNNRIMLRGDVAKNGKTNFIPLPSLVKEAIETLPKTSEYLFTGKNGNPREDFKRIAKRLKEKAGLPKNFRPTYMLRHNFATHLASSGKVDLYTIQKLMTHESPQMTQRYAHLMDKNLYEGSKVIEDLFGDNES